MKKIFISVLAITFFSQISFGASTLKCRGYFEYPGPQQQVGDGIIANAGFVFNSVSCTDKKGRVYDVFIQGIGPLIDFTNEESSFFMFCPFVKQKNLAGDYYGIELKAGAILGLRNGLNVGKNGKVCYLSEINFSGGGGAVIEKMTITDHYKDYDYERAETF